MLRSLAAAAAVAVTITLTGCGSTEPSPMLSVDGKDYTESDVAELAQGYCATIEDQLAKSPQQAGAEAPKFPMAEIEGLMVRALAAGAIGDSVAEEAGNEKVPAQIKQQIDQLRDNIKTLPENQARASEVLELDGNLGMYHLQSVAFADAEGQLDQKTAEKMMAEVMDKWTSEHELSVSNDAPPVTDQGPLPPEQNPFSLIDPWMSADGLSVPVSEAAKEKKQPEPVDVDKLPADQVCGG